MISTAVVRNELAISFSLRAVKDMLKALRILQARLAGKNGEATPAPHGVCSALDRILPLGADPYSFVRIAVGDWQEAVRNEDGTAASYPVSTMGGFWVGENRAARIRLIAHLIQHCEALIAAREWAALAHD